MIEPCGLAYAHEPHSWFDGDHDLGNRWCPGVTPDPCATCSVCGHEGVVLIRREDGTLVCVDCDAKERGEETYA